MLNDKERHRKKATKDSWKHQPLPESVARLQLEKTFSKEEYEKLSYGLIPVEMEDKWFVYLEQDRLYFHRSWTGRCVYEIRLEQNSDTYSVASALVNRDPEQYRERDDKYDAALLSFLIDNFLLGKRTPFPLPSNLPKDSPKGLYQHHISGSGYPEAEFEKDKDDE